MAKFVPSYTGTLRSHTLMLPACISDCSGIRIFGRRIKSLAFSTDVAIIKNINADAIFAVYPFTPQTSIAQSIISISDVPVFVGVGGGITTGQRAVHLAVQAEHEGAYGVILNAPTSNEILSHVKREIDIPVIVTVTSAETDISSRLKAGADILNVAGGLKTAAIVASIRRDFPEAAIIATGGPSEESIRETIRAGANAITYAPPSTEQLFHTLMQKYRAPLDNE